MYALGSLKATRQVDKLLARSPIADEAQAQIIEITHLTYSSLTCTARCLVGPVRVGDSMRLVTGPEDQPIAEELTVSDILFYANVPSSFVDVGRAALITLSGAVDVAAVRAVAPDGRRDLRLIAQGT